MEDRTDLYEIFDILSSAKREHESARTPDAWIAVRGQKIFGFGRTDVDALSAAAEVGQDVERLEALPATLDLVGFVAIHRTSPTWSLVEGVATRI